MRGELERFVGNACIENVRFLGHLPDDSMASVVREAMFTVVPSEWYELFGLVIAESFAWGKPVIGSRLGAVPELIDDGEDGLLFEPGNADDLAEKIRHLIDNQHLLGEMGRRAREKVEIRYNPQLHYQRLMDIYRSVIR